MADSDFDRGKSKCPESLPTSHKDGPECTWLDPGEQERGGAQEEEEEEPIYKS